MWKAAFLNLAFVAAVTNVGLSQPDGIRRLSPAEQRIGDAAKIKDRGQRDAALRAAIEDGLLRSPRSVSGVVGKYLAANDRWIDLRQFEDLIRQVPDGGERWVSAIEWGHLSPAERSTVCGEAIEQGRATAPGGMIINREVAMRSVAWYGLVDLLPMVDKYFPLLSRASGESLERGGYGLSQIVIRAGLRAGGDGPEDCWKRVAQRLTAMSDADFRHRMEIDSNFAEVLLGRGVNAGEIAYICSANPFSGWVNPGCSEIHTICDRQETLRAQLKGATRKGQFYSKMEGRISEATWLQRMEWASRYDPRHPKK